MQPLTKREQHAAILQATREFQAKGGRIRDLGAQCVQCAREAAGHVDAQPIENPSDKPIRLIRQAPGHRALLARLVA